MGSVPFTKEAFLEVFARYNEAVGAAPVLLSLLAAVAVIAALRSSRGSRPLALLGAGLWAWSGAVYHLGFFRAINPAATLFGLLFLVQALLFAVAGLRRDPLRLRPRWTARGIAGGVLVLYALVVYPLLGWTLGEPYPMVPTFGVPCPVVIFTFGLLLWSEPGPSWWLVPIPLGWSLVGGSATFSLGVTQDLGLLLAGPIATILIVRDARDTLSRGGPTRSDAREAGLRRSVSPHTVSKETPAETRRFRGLP